MEALRMGLLEQQQRFANIPFEGEPVAPHRVFYSPSLPPAPPKPKAPPPSRVELAIQARIQRELTDTRPLHDDPFTKPRKEPSPEQLARALARERKSTQVQQAKAMLLEGVLTTQEIADRTGLTRTAVYTHKYDMGLGGERPRNSRAQLSHAHRKLPEEERQERAHRALARIRYAQEKAEQLARVHALLRAGTLTAREIGLLEGMSTTAVHKHKARLGLTNQPVQQAPKPRVWPASIHVQQQSNRPTPEAPASPAPAVSPSTPPRPVHVRCSPGKPQPIVNLRSRPTTMAQSIAQAFAQFR